MKKEKKIIVKKGQTWKENDNRYNRLIEIIDIKKGKVFIKTISDSGRLVDRYRITVANIKRFNGKHGGYSLYSNILIG